MSNDHLTPVTRNFAYVIVLINWPYSVLRWFSECPQNLGAWENTSWHPLTLGIDTSVKCQCQEWGDVAFGPFLYHRVPSRYKQVHVEFHDSDSDINIQWLTRQSFYGADSECECLDVRLSRFSGTSDIYHLPCKALWEPPEWFRSIVFMSHFQVIIVHIKTFFIDKAE